MRLDREDEAPTRPDFALAEPEGEDPTCPDIQLQAHAGLGNRPFAALAPDPDVLGAILESLDPRKTEWRALDDGCVVERFNVAGTPTWVYQAWEPRAEGSTNHSTITHGPSGEPLGKIGTRRLPPAEDALPPGIVRSSVVKAWYEAQYEAAYRAILQAFPEALFGRRDMGEITGIIPASVRMAHTPDRGRIGDDGRGREGK